MHLLRFAMPRTLAVLALATTAAAGLSAVHAAAAPASHPAPSVVRIVAGAHSVTAAHQRWTSDRAYARGGRYSATSRHIAGTATPQLFRQERYGRFSYRVPVQSGTYRVTVNMAEHTYATRGRRVFGIVANGHPVARHVDAVAAVGRLHAYSLTFTAAAPHGVLRIAFTRRHSTPALSSISMTRLPDRSGLTAAATPSSVPGASATASRAAAATTSTPTASPTVSQPVTPTPTATSAPTPTPTPTTAPAPTYVHPESFGAVANGSTDDTTALQAAFDAATPSTPVLLQAGRVYAHAGVLHIRKAGEQVLGGGLLLATNEATSSVWIEADNVVVTAVTIQTQTTTTRWGTWEQMGVRIDGHTGVVLRNVTVDGSAAAGIYVGGAATHFTLDHVTVVNTRADGIHMTDGASYGTVISPTVINSGDDGVAVVSYTQDGAPCHDITVAGPRVLDQSYGRGLSVVGGTNITESNIDVENSDAAAVYIAAEGSPWYTTAPQNVTITGGRIIGANTDTGIDHGAVLVMAGESGVAPANVTVTGLTIINTRATVSRNFGVVTYGQAPTNVMFSNLTIAGGPTSAYGGNTPQSSYRLRNIIQNGVRLADAG